MNNKLITSIWQNIFIATLSFFTILSCSAQNSLMDYDAENKTNSFFDNAEVTNLLVSEIEVTGEVDNSGRADLSKLPLREIIVKEIISEDGKDKFIGAYRYVGYSLADIISPFVANKINAKEFPPQTDLYVEIENSKGEKVCVSWGEIYYANGLNDVIIATAVARIIPDKTKDMWELPVESKLIIGNDLYTYRNISNPVKITVKSYSNPDIEIIKGKDPLFSDKIDVYSNGELISTIDSNYDFSKTKTVHTIFYGKGRGLHTTNPYTGVDLKDVILSLPDIIFDELKNALIVVVADDGYRTVYTFSEIANRNDQSSVLLLCDKELKNDGIFRVYPSCDFFSDRSIKGVDRIYILK
jgi:hypothetical protein